MNGHKFEYKCARMLRRKGFHHVEVTKKSGDQGVDIIAGVLRLRDVVHCDIETIEQIVQTVDARAEHALEAAVAIHQAALAVADHDPLQKQHG